MQVFHELLSTETSKKNYLREIIKDFFYAKILRVYQFLVKSPVLEFRNYSIFI